MRRDTLWLMVRDASKNPIYRGATQAPAPSSTPITLSQTSHGFNPGLYSASSVLCCVEILVHINLKYLN